RFRQLQQAIRDLQVTDRQIVLLHLEGLSYSEIEAVSGLSESAIATRLTRIRGELKEKITGRRAGPDGRGRRVAETLVRPAPSRRSERGRVAGSCAEKDVAL